MLIAKMIQFVVFGAMRVSEKQVSFSIKHLPHMHTKEPLTCQITSPVDLLIYVMHNEIIFALDVLGSLAGKSLLGQRAPQTASGIRKLDSK